MLRLHSGKDSISIDNYKWDAGMAKLSEWHNGRAAGDLKFTLFECDVDAVKNAITGCGDWDSTENPDCCYAVSVEITETDPQGVITVISFECFRWESYKSEGDTVKVKGQYVEK
jgi:hypothetical protein